MAIEALRWIHELLNEREIPFVVCGGLAAIGYGSTRPLNDIDLFVPGRHFQSVVSAAADCISKPARRYREEGWDLEYVQFIYEGTKVEVGNAEDAMIFDAGSGQWVALAIDFSRACDVEVLGITVPAMRIEDLISYKRILDRPVDREDIAEIENRA
ncbi:nucleotidyltransferase [Marinobacterium aestuariivivens]|uniref:Nucleotidyltransferase n=1 Tax=Marinobacterium aestuariivivens TaxID=1698799 RepID=A0ABW2A4J2_9GAMM